MFYETEGQHASIDDQFLLGRSLLVAPILHEGQSMRSVILPQGSWWDVLQAMRIEGPCTVQRSYSLDQIGLFIRIDGPNSEALEFLKA
jgi:alpha-glucosidase (family GH31 glycosyl hydrolase)